MDIKEKTATASDDASNFIPNCAELFCDSCLQDGDEQPAEGYCVDCDHHLCGPCFTIHRKPQPLRHHQLLAKEEMPTAKSTRKPKDECTDRCTVHKDEIIKYYCKDHEQFGCTVCITLGHRTCNVGYIPTLAENILDSDEYKSLKQALDGLSQRANRCSDLATENTKAIQKQTGRNNREIKTLLKEVNDFFDKLKKEAKEAILKHQSENQTKLKQLAVASNALGGQIREAQGEMKYKETTGQKCRLFVRIKDMKKDIGKYEKEIADLENGNKLQHMSFVPSSCIIDLVRNDSATFGACVSHDKDITINTSDRPIGKTISETLLLAKKKLVVVNESENYLLIIDTERNQVQKSKSFSCALFGLTRVSDTELAIWVDKKIEIYSTSNELQQKMIPCPGLRWPILYTNNTFIGFTESTPHVVKIIDTDGNDIKVFPAEVEGKEITFGNPHYIAVNLDNTLLYVSDHATKIVTCLSMTGELRADFQPQGKWDPRGIALSRDGTVYVCDISKHNIFVLTSDLKEVGVIDGKMFGITHPISIAYCVSDHKLYIGMYKSTKMAVLKIQ